MPHFTLDWIGDAASGSLVLLDQTKLPLEMQQVTCRELEEVVEAIGSLRVRGAPAIGVAAAYGVVVGLQTSITGSREEFDQSLERVLTTLAASRPTAVNLTWALKRMDHCARSLPGHSPPEVLQQLLDEARTIEAEDQATCAAIGEAGLQLVPAGGSVLTHCNAGGLATAGSGTALSILFAAARDGREFQVYVDETRPLLQGARLTTWELLEQGIPATLICDSMAGWAMKNGRVQAVITGADRIAANGDVANKIGTYSLSVLARTHEVPFYVAAPSSTFDLSLDSGNEIPIEQRASEEITHGFGQQTAPAGIETWNPAFDVTPAENITALVTEHGLIEPVTHQRIAEVLSQPGMDQ